MKCIHSPIKCKCVIFIRCSDRSQIFIQVSWLGESIHEVKRDEPTLVNENEKFDGESIELQHVLQ